MGMLKKEVSVGGYAQEEVSVGGYAQEGGISRWVCSRRRYQ